MTVLKKLWRNFLWQLLSFLPKQPKKAVCQSYYGRGYSDSPKALAEELHRRGWKLYWVVRGAPERETLPGWITPILLDSPSAIYHLCTAQLWVDNCRKWAYTQKRGKTFYVQTWHGFPLKRIEGDAADALAPEYLVAAKKDSRLADLFLSDSRFLTDIYRRAFWYDGPVLECGFPRNDVLVHGDPAAQQNARKVLELPEDVKLLLYAPTFRKDLELAAYDVDYARCVQALEARFGGKWLILARLHPNIASRSAEMKLDPQYIRNASFYPDIQDLYLISDALLTDYSSVMFDYLPAGKPCFLYVNDLDAYRGDRNFTFDLEKLPYPRATTNDELAGLIAGYDPDAQRAAVQAFTQEFGINTDGTAAKLCADYLEQHL